MLCFFSQFGEQGGFTAIQEKLNSDELEIAVSADPPPTPCTLHAALFCLSTQLHRLIFRVMKLVPSPRDGCRQPIRGKGHRARTSEPSAAVGGGALHISALTRTQTCSLISPLCAASNALLCYVFLRHPCTDGPFWEPQPEPLLGPRLRILSHTHARRARHAPSSN